MGDDRKRQKFVVKKKFLINDTMISGKRYEAQQGIDKQ